MQTSHQPTLDRTHRIGLSLPPTTAPAGQDCPDIGALEQQATTISVHKDAELYAQGDPARYCYRIVAGCVRTVKLMDDGRRQINEFLLPGDWLGVEALAEHDLAAEAVTAVTVRRYPRRALDQAAGHDCRVAHWLLGIASRQLRNARDRMVTLGRKSASERVAGFLLEMVDRVPHESAGHVPLPMSRGDIADHLGLTIETVCRCLAQFRRDGTIALGRATFAVRSQAAMLALARATRH